MQLLNSKYEYQPICHREEAAPNAYLSQASVAQSCTCIQTPQSPETALGFRGFGFRVQGYQKLEVPQHSRRWPYKMYIIRLQNVYEPTVVSCNTWVGLSI